VIANGWERFAVSFPLVENSIGIVNDATEGGQVQIFEFCEQI